VIGQADRGNGEDHGSWFEPTLITRSGKKIKLTDIKWKKAKGGWGKTLVNKDCTGKPLARHDGTAVPFGIGTHAPSTIQFNRLPKDVVRFQAYGGLSAGGRNGSVEFYVNSNGQGAKAGTAKIPEGPHATPNAPIILPHVAVKSLVALDAAAECVKAIGGANEQGALWALRHMHNDTAVDGLIAKLSSAIDSETRQRLALTLVRLIHHEKPYDGSTWWGTRPDTRGPYYYPTPWAGTDKIKAALLAAFKSGDPALQYVIATLSEKDRAPIQGLPKATAVAAAPTANEPTVDLEKIKNQKGQVGKMGVEDVILALGKVQGDPARGMALFTRQGCVACHTLREGEPLKGPFMGQIGSIMKRDQIAMSILKPTAVISQGFKTVQIQTKKGQVFVGFVSKRLSDLVEIRDISGRITALKPADIASEKILDISMMPAGLVNGLSLEEFASLVSFLERQKK